jgi:hypothetical protein
MNEGAVEVRRWLRRQTGSAARVKLSFRNPTRKKVRSSGFSALPDSFIAIIFLLVVRGDHLLNQTEQPWT